MNLKNLIKERLEAILKTFECQGIEHIIEDKKEGVVVCNCVVDEGYCDRNQVLEDK